MTDAPAPPPTTERHVLLLQGPASFFFTYLGRALGRHSARVSRILLCPGDWLFWRAANGDVFRGAPAEWPGFVAHYAKTKGITDLVCLGDGRRWHRDAIDAVTPLGIRIHIVEQGYLRPHRLTVERDGTGGLSRFPRDWPAIERLAQDVTPTRPPTYKTSFAAYAVMDVAWNLANLLLGRPIFPHYRTHSIDGPLREWAGWIAKAIRSPLTRRRTARAMARIDTHTGPVFLMALQLETDFQIRLHGPCEGMRPALASTIASFAAHAPTDALLVIKRHPLDNGWSGWGRQIKGAAAIAGIADRVIDLDGGDLTALLKTARGVVTVNSTVGLTALQAGVPVLTLGTAIYDLPGLTHRDGRETFWTAPAPVDPARCITLIRALEAHSQIPGNFDGTGAIPGAEAMADRILNTP